MPSLFELRTKQSRIKRKSNVLGSLCALLLMPFVLFIHGLGIEKRTAMVFTFTTSVNLGGHQFYSGDSPEVVDETGLQTCHKSGNAPGDSKEICWLNSEVRICLKVPEGEKCWATPEGLRRINRTDLPNIFNYGYVGPGYLYNYRNVPKTIFLLCATFVVAMFCSARIIGYVEGKRIKAELKKAEAEELIEAIAREANLKLEGIKKSICSLATQSKISGSFSDLTNFSSEIRDFINTHHEQLLRDPAPLSAFIVEVIRRAEGNLNQLKQAIDLYQVALSAYVDTSRQVNRTGSVPLIKELEYNYAGLTHADLIALLSQKRWNEFHDIVNSIIEDLQRLKNLAVKYELHEEESEEFGEDSSVIETDEEKAYRILGITPTTTDEQIKKLYKKLASIYHPDASVVNDDEKFKEINWAYGVLKAQRNIS